MPALVFCHLDPSSLPRVIYQHRLLDVSSTLHFSCHNPSVFMEPTGMSDFSAVSLTLASVGRVLWSPGARSTRPGPASSPGPTQPSPEDTALTRCAPALLSRSSWLHICLLQTVQHSPTEMLHNYTPCLHSVVFLGLKLQILNYEPFGPVHLFSVLVVWFLFSTKHKLTFPWMLFPLPFYLWNMTFALTGYSGMHS